MCTVDQIPRFFNLVGLGDFSSKSHGIPRDYIYYLSRRYLKDRFFVIPCSLEWARNDNSHPEFITLLISVMNSGWQLSFRAHSDEHGTMKNQSLRYLNFSQYFHFFFFFELLPKHFCSYFQLIYFENYSKIYDLLEHSLKLPKCIPLIFHNLLAKCNDYQTKITNLGPFLFPQFPHCKSHGLRDWKYLHPNCVQSWSHEFFFEIID